MERELASAPVKIAPLKKEAVLPLIAAALKEDIGARDLTTSILVPKGRSAEAELVVREDGVIAGLQVAEWCFNQVDAEIRFRPTARDGAAVHPGKVAAFIEGPARGILMAERTALNFLGHLCGVATLTRAFVDRAQRHGAKIMDTRKTTPLLRLLEKYAVAAGGGVMHRMGLYDQVLVKDNHLKLLAGAPGGPSAIERAVAQARKGAGKNVIVEVEASNLQEFREALSAQADIVLLDNMPVEQIREAVRLRDALARSSAKKKVLLEASGGVTLDNVEAIAAAGVERISVGALTHSARRLDVALEMVR